MRMPPLFPLAAVFAVMVAALAAAQAAPGGAPEPASLALVMSGLLALAAALRDDA